MLTKGKLNRLRGEDRLIAVVEASSKKRRRLMRGGVSLARMQPRGQRNVTLYYLLDTHVRKGGLARFVRRADDELRVAVLEALSYFGAWGTKRVVHEAMQRCEGRPKAQARLTPAGKTEGPQLTDEFRVEDLDAELTATTENVEALMLRAIEERPGEFVEESRLERLFAGRARPARPAQRA